MVKHSGNDANEMEAIAIAAHMLVSHTHKQVLHAFVCKIVWVSSLVILVATVRVHVAVISALGSERQMFCSIVQFA